jgi:hypothetical protein
MISMYKWHKIREMKQKGEGIKKRAAHIFNPRALPEVYEVRLAGAFADLLAETLEVKCQPNLNRSCAVCQGYQPMPTFFETG